MSYQIIHSNFRLLFLASIFLLSGLFLVSCNSEQDKSTTNAATTATPAGQAPAASANVQFPTFRINASALPALTGGVGNVMPSKFIIKYEIENITNPISSMVLWLYPANGHMHYGTGTTNPVRGARHSTTTLTNVTNMVWGNNEIATTSLVGSPPNHTVYQFEYLILTPKLSSGNSDNKPHLIFSIEAYRGTEKITTLVIPDSNPCPPNQPSGT